MLVHSNNMSVMFYTNIINLINYLPNITFFYLVLGLCLAAGANYSSTLYYRAQAISMVKFSTSVVLSTNLSLVLLKFFLQLIFLSGPNKLCIINNGGLETMQSLSWNLLGTSLLMLCYITSMVCLFYLGDRNIFSNNLNFYYFLFFITSTTFLVQTTNLLTMFLCFELIFLPSLFFVYKLGYVKKVDKTIYFLLLWTLTGSFIVLFALAYIYALTKSLSYNNLRRMTFSETELFWVYLMLFVGYGVKIPLFPFHYWLTKVHVEAPAGFSIFLSGFLVKTAAYCFYFITLLMQLKTLKIMLTLWIMLGIAEASLKMWSQLDIKKLVAFATVQEMNLILLCLINFQQIHVNILAIFFLLHGLLSTYMFLLVDQIQKRMQTRNVISLGGSGIAFKNLTLFIWVMLIIFLGIPGTSKFLVEWNVGFLLIQTAKWLGILTLCVAVASGGIGFTKCWLIIVYGTPSEFFLNQERSVVDLFTKDILLFSVLTLLIFLLNLLVIVTFGC